MAALDEHGPMTEDQLFEMVAPIKARKHPRCYRGINRRILCGWFFVVLWDFYARGLIAVDGEMIRRL